MSEGAVALIWFLGFLSGFSGAMVSFGTYLRDRALRAERLVEALREDMELEQ